MYTYSCIIKNFNNFFFLLLLNQYIIMINSRVLIEFLIKYYSLSFLLI